jgi:hypothetical protein
MGITFEQFLLSKHTGQANVYYCGGALVIFKPAENEQDDKYVLECDGNMVMIDQLHVLERHLYADIGFEYELRTLHHFKPDQLHASRGTHAGMITLLGDYCNFYGITAVSIAELAVETALHEWHLFWFRNFKTVWDDIPPVEIVASPYKWICGECGEQSIYWDTSAYWNTENQKLEMSDAISVEDMNVCSECDAENQAKKVEI